MEFLKLRRVPLEERQCFLEASDIVPQASTSFLLRISLCNSWP